MRTRGGKKQRRREEGEETQGREGDKKDFQCKITIMATFIYELCSIIYPKMLFWTKSQKNCLTSTRM